MTQPTQAALHIVCLASYFKGNEFLRQCKSQGCHVTLVTREKALEEEWARDSLDDLIALPNEATAELYTHVVSELGRRKRLDRIVALEEFDVTTAALLREHLCLPGTSATTARLFRDKLAMRVKAREAGILAPQFVHALNYDEVGHFMERVPAPWVLKPRSDVSAVGIKKLHQAEEVWRAIDLLDARERLRERPSYYLLERFVAGDVYHVDSLVENGRVVFAGANKYGRPPMDVAHEGGVFLSHTIAHGSREQRELFKLNRRLIKSMGLTRGATHAEFIKATADGRFYFLEIASRVGGAYIAEVLEASTGLNLWREWARIELACGDGSYRAAPARKEYGGIALSLARQEHPNTDAYTDTEIFYRVTKRHHAGLVVRSPRLERVHELLDQYARRFAIDFSAIIPPLERIEE